MDNKSGVAPEQVQILTGPACQDDPVFTRFLRKNLPKKIRSTSSVHPPESWQLRRLGSYRFPISCSISGRLARFAARCQDVRQFEPYLHALAEWDPSETYESPKNTEWFAARKRTNAITRPWHAPSTQAKDRKRMLRLLIKDITVNKLVEQRQLSVHVRWQGGACTDLFVQIPPSAAGRHRYRSPIVDRIRDLACSLLDAQI